MSSASAGWYVDPSTGTNLRFWNGTTWTDEVAPLPYDGTPVFSTPVAVQPVPEPAPEPAAAQPDPEPAVEPAAEQPVPEPEPEPTAVQPVPEPEPEPAAAQPVPEPAHEPVAEATPPDEAPGIPDLDPEVEHTQLTRRELRARRGTDSELDDAPKHLAQMTPPAAASVEHWPEPVEELAPAHPIAEQSDPESDPSPDPVQRRLRIVRMSVLLGVLAVVSSVAVLTAGTI